MVKLLLTCIAARMLNQDITDLFRRVDVGTNGRRDELQADRGIELVKIG